jgi:SPP1 family predicted phage head-tail adaptor
MVSLATKMRNRIDGVFDLLGKTVTFKKNLSLSYNSRGEETEDTQEESSIVIIPYSAVTNDQSYEAFGNVERGDIDAAVKYTVEISIDDTITMDSVDYRVKAIDKTFVPENVVTIIRLSRNY